MRLASYKTFVTAALIQVVRPSQRPGTAKADNLATGVGEPLRARTDSAWGPGGRPNPQLTYPRELLALR